MKESATCGARGIHTPTMGQGREHQGEDKRTEALILSKIVIVMSAAQDICRGAGDDEVRESGSLSGATLSSRGNKYGRETLITIAANLFPNRCQCRYRTIGVICMIVSPGTES